VEELGAKLAQVLSPGPDRPRAEAGAYRISTADFPALLERLTAGPWSLLERRTLRLLFVPEGGELTFALAAGETRTLDEWDHLNEAVFLADLLDQDALVTHFQPIWDLRSRSLYGWECLTRGLGPEGLIPPGRLFAAAQAGGLLFSLDRQARLTALRNAHRAALPGVLFINFVPTAIYDPVFCLRSTTELARTLGLDPARLVFEVVESEEVEDRSHLSRIVGYYRDQGFRVALDDVGSGYASLNLLASLKPDVLKVDAGLIRHLDADLAHQAVFRALASVARDTGALLLAEGIETEAELAWAADHGADLAQGFLWGRPVPELPRNLDFGQRPGV